MTTGPGIPAGEWWPRVSPTTRQWLLSHPRERISWHIWTDLRASGAQVIQPDMDRSEFLLSEDDWIEIERLR